jgi:RNA polymerase sigma-70 factor (ECF subfamily)
MMTRSDFDLLYAERAEALLVFFARRTVDAETALDLWAETWAQAFAARGRFRGESREQSVSWLYGIAYRQLALLWRRGRVEQRAMARLGLERPALADADIERLEELAGMEALRAQIARALATLPVAQRDAVRLRIVDELPYEEVALRLRVTEQAARARVSRALRALGRELDHEPLEVPA